ncbi:MULTISPECIES: Na+/H+ antiporter family protein [Vibrio]|uniref:Sodium:proton antiporter n=1 Tax=Vibrio casei TaxID=673372 RepID=A0A368LPW6_9VIBR|nr:MULTISPECIES: Na+/H+ antiporter family protein [Vibrio]RCS73533.1 sodium:proton antiporter [Vibrio casei]SJN26036.1 Histidine permease YuiF [Vibrio casei]HBV77488.1 sodium:proton antiporter [Vibrio sp.]
MNPVVISVCLMLALSVFRVNVVIALTLSAITGGLIANMSLDQTISAFQSGLGDGAEIALSYALLGAFAVALSQTGITDILSNAVIKRVHGKKNEKASSMVKYAIFGALFIMAIFSQNVIPVHIAFIPIIVPPLLSAFNKMNIDRRMVACILTFGLVTPYMTMPIGFGGIFLNDILLPALQNNGLTSATAAQIPAAMVIPACGMIFGLLVSVFISYRKPRTYTEKHNEATEVKQKGIDKKAVIVAIVSIIATLSAQLYSGSMIVGALVGFIILSFGKPFQTSQDSFTRGVQMMAMIGFIMISANGFASVMKATGGVETLVTFLQTSMSGHQALAALMMLIVGLLITMGIGSSFSTIPIIATIYVPLAISFGFSPAATIALVGTAAALGDAGSPASDSTLGPTSGLNADGQHDHIKDSVIPTFLHYNLPLIAFGWIAAMVL